MKIVLAVDIGASHVRIAVSDLAGRPLRENSAAIAVAEGPDAVLDWVIEAGDALVSDAARSLSDLLAIGVGLPGPVEYSSGRPINPPIMPGWDRFDVRGRLQAHFDVPVLVDNDVNIMALGEREVAWPDVDHLIFVKVATGIGSGVISGGILQRGAQGIAGDIGHVQVSRGAEVPRHRGNRGCLEAIQAVRQPGRDLGEVLTACVSLINPSVIVIGGSMAQAGEHLIAGVREVVYTRSMPLATQHLQITQSTAGPDAAVLGASMLAIHHALSPARVDAMVLDLLESTTVTR
jgi:predicted NBD/HSP70 family sugar kinase